MNTVLRRLLVMAALLAPFVLTACGNKGELVRPGSSAAARS